MQTLTHLTDEELVAELHACCAEGRQLTARLLLFLIEVEERRIHLQVACPSMFAFCTERLGMSGGRAYRHITGARLVRRFPFLLDRIASGEVFLSTLATMASFLNEENIHALLEETRGKRRSEVEMILARRFDIRPYRYGPVPNIPIDAELAALLQWAREHFSNAVPDGDFMTITKRVYAELKQRVEKEQRKAAEAAPRAKKPTKKVPERNRQYVQARDGRQCTYVDPTSGRRCSGMAFLDIDHIIGRADGGGHDPENMRVACRAHNKWFAELRYGKDYIEKRIRQRKCVAKKSSRTARPKATPQRTEGQRVKDDGVADLVAEYVAMVTGRAKGGELEGGEEL